MLDMSSDKDISYLACIKQDAVQMPDSHWPYISIDFVSSDGMMFALIKNPVRSNNEELLYKYYD